MVTFLHGAAAMGCLTAGLFFLKFWRETHDRLFLMFALAFWMIAAERVVLGLSDGSDRMARIRVSRPPGRVLPHPVRNR